MASVPPPQPSEMASLPAEQTWAGLGVDRTNQKQILTRLLNFPNFSEGVLPVFKEAGITEKLGSYTAVQLKSMFDTEYIVSLADSEGEYREKFRDLAEKGSQWLASIATTYPGNTLAEAFEKDSKTNSQQATVSEESDNNVQKTDVEMSDNPPIKSKYSILEKWDVDMGNTSQQPPDDWPPPIKDRDMVQYRNENSPLTWIFTEEQNKRKLNWLKRVINTPKHEITMENLLKSVMAADIIRREWYTNEKLQRKPKIKDLNHLLHPDKAAIPFQEQAGKYNMSYDEIKELHSHAFHHVKDWLDQVSKIETEDFLEVCGRIDGFHEDALFRGKDNITEDDGEDSDDDGVKSDEEEGETPCDSDLKPFHKDFHRDQMYPIIRRGYLQVIENNNHEDDKVKYENIADIPMTSEITSLNQQVKAYNEQKGLQPETGLFPWTNMVWAWRSYNEAIREKDKEKSKVWKENAVARIEKHWKLRQFPSNWKSMPPEPDGHYPSPKEKHQTYQDEYRCDPLTGKPLRTPRKLNLPEPPASAIPQRSPGFGPMRQPQSDGTFQPPPEQVSYENRVFKSGNRCQVLISSQPIKRQINPGFTQDGDPLVAVFDRDIEEPSEGAHTYVVNLKGTDNHVIMSENECGGPGVYDEKIPKVIKDAAKIFARHKYKKSWVRKEHGIKWIAIGKAAALAKSKPLMIASFYWTCPTEKKHLDMIMFRSELEKIIGQIAVKSIFCDMIHLTYGWRPDSIEDALQRLQNVTVLKRQPQQYGPPSSALVPWRPPIDEFARMNLGGQQTGPNMQVPPPHQAIPDPLYASMSQATASNAQQYQQPQYTVPVPPQIFGTQPAPVPPVQPLSDLHQQQPMQSFAQTPRPQFGPQPLSGSQSPQQVQFHTSIPQQRYMNNNLFGYPNPSNELQLYQSGRSRPWMPPQLHGSPHTFGQQTPLGNIYMNPQLLNTPFGGLGAPNPIFRQYPAQQTWNPQSPIIFGGAANQGAQEKIRQGQGQQGQPGQGYPGQGQPEQGQPGQGQPGQGQPGQEQPGQEQPGQGQPVQGQQGRE